MAFTQVGIGAGGAFSCAAEAANGDVYVLGDVGGIFKSTNAGATWTPIGSAKGVNDENLYGIDCHPTNPDIVVAVGDGGVAPKTCIIRTTNATGNCTWSEIASPAYGSGVCFAPSDGNRCYVATTTSSSTADTVMYRSVDAGANFTSAYAFSTVLTNPRVNRFWVHPTDPDTVYGLSMADKLVSSVTPARAIVKSTNAGSTPPTFARIGPQVSSAFVDVYSFAIDPSTPTTLYCTTATKVYRSIDSGDNWTPVKDLPKSGNWQLAACNIGPTQLASIVVDPDLTGSGFTAYQTVFPYDGTDTVIDYLLAQGFSADIDQTDPGYAGNPVLSMSVRLNGVIGDSIPAWTVNFDNSVDGAFTSVPITTDNSGAPWNATSVAAVTTLQGFRTYAVGAGAMGGFSSLEVWANITRVTVTDVSDKSSAVFRSDDHGTTWIQSSRALWETGWKESLTAIGMYSRQGYGDGKTILNGRGANVWWVTNNFVFASTDGGVTYRQVFSTPEVVLVSAGRYQPTGFWATTGLDNAVPRALSAASPLVVYASYYDLGIFRSDTAGAYWKEINSSYGWSDGKGGNCYALLADPGSLGKVWAGQSLEQWGPHVMLRSDNYGEMWQTVTGMPPQVFAPTGPTDPDPSTRPNPPLITGLSMDPTSPAGNRTLYCCVGDSSVGTGKLYKSTDDGRNWAAIVTGGITTTGLRVTACYGPLVMAGGESGLWRSSDSGANWVQINNASQFPSSSTDQLKIFNWLWPGIHSILINGTDVWVSYYTGSLNSGGLFKSTDSGVTFPARSALPTAQKNGYSREIIKDPANTLWWSQSSGIESGVNKDSGSLGLFKSVDNGANWVRQMTTLPWSEAAFPIASATDSSWIMFGQSGTGFWKQ